MSKHQKLKSVSMGPPIRNFNTRSRVTFGLKKQLEAPTSYGSGWAPEIIHFVITSVIRNQCAAAHWCATSRYQVCREFLLETIFKY
jgi:hypothetical protein